MSALSRYRPSGRMGSSAIVMALAAGTVGAAILGWAYQAAVDWIPLVYVNVLATMGFGWALGFLVARALRKGHGRNVAAAVAIAGLAAVLGDAVSFHAGYRRVHAEAEKIRAAFLKELSPEDRAEAVEELDYPFSEYLSDRAENGWTLGSESGLPIRGALVWGVWVLELGILVGFAARFALRAARAPYCEPCGAWTVGAPVASMAGVDDGALRAAVAAGDLATLLSPPRRAGGGVGVEFVQHGCPTCDTRFLTATLRWRTEPTRRKKQEEKRETLVEAAVVTPADVESVRAAASGSRSEGAPRPPETPVA